MTLTKGMLKALNQIGYGVKATIDGYICIVENERLDLRSADALCARDLIFYTYDYGSGNLYLTKEGQKIFDESVEES